MINKYYNKILKKWLRYIKYYEEQKIFFNINNIYEQHYIISIKYEDEYITKYIINNYKICIDKINEIIFKILYINNKIYIKNNKIDINMDEEIRKTYKEYKFKIKIDDSILITYSIEKINELIEWDDKKIIKITNKNEIMNTNRCGYKTYISDEEYCEKNSYYYKKYKMRKTKSIINKDNIYIDERYIYRMYRGGIIGM
jgi:hypothetical protein